MDPIKIQIKKIDTVNTTSGIDIGYEVEGILISEFPIKIGRQVEVKRSSVSKGVVVGCFITSRVMSVTDQTFTTKNSIYSYKILSS